MVFLLAAWHLFFFWKYLTCAHVSQSPTTSHCNATRPVKVRVKVRMWVSLWRILCNVTFFQLILGQVMVCQSRNNFFIWEVSIYLFHFPSCNTACFVLKTSLWLELTHISNIILNVNVSAFLREQEMWKNYFHADWSCFYFAYETIVTLSNMLGINMMGRQVFPLHE